MTEPQHHLEFGAQYWEERYRTLAPSSPHGPSPSLVVETAELAPGTALDAGCGRGADAIWLAAHGWQVTAVDVAATVLAQAQESARAAGPDIAERIAWIRADLTEWSPGERRFDLVTSHYVHVAGSVEELFSRLASWVAPGGTLLVAGHDGATAAGSGPHGHAHPPASLIRTELITAVLDPSAWDIVVAEPRPRTVPRPDGDVRFHDVVVRALRTAG